MAAIFQIKRGTTNETLTDGELYLHKGSGSIQFGSGSSNVITLLPLNVPVAGNINLIGNISASGDVRIGGNIYLGNDTASAQPDSISALGIFTTNLVPNGTIDLGTTTAKWNNVYANNISGAIAATNGVISGSSQVISILTSLNTFSGSQLTQNTALATISGSLILTASANTISITNLNSFSSSQLTQNIALATISGSLISTASNHEQRLGEIESKSGSYDTRFNSLATISGSLISTASANTISITNLNSFSSSQLTENSNLATITGSLISTASANVLSIAELNSYTSSLKTAITASGADITINGNLTVKGTTTQIDSTTLNIGDNIIQLNGSSVANAGLQVKDTTGASGSLLWDSTLDYWKGGTLGNESKLLLAGGDSVISASSQLTELNSFTGSQLTQNTNLATISGSLISTASANTISITNLNSFSSSQLSQNTALATISGSLIGSASANTISITNINTITTSLNISVTNINSFTSSQLTQNTTLGSYTASVNQTTSSLNLYTASANTWSGTIDTRFTTLGLYTASVNQTTSSLNSYTASISTSFGQFSSSYAADSASFDYRIDILDPGNLSGNLLAIQQTTASLNTFSASAKISITNIEAATSSYETNGRGIVSGSSQITYASISSIPSGIVSGSSQILGGSGIVSGSSQITYASISSIPSGIVSGSSQITYASISSIPSGIVSGAAQIPALLPSGVVSGSSQILGGSGIVSGSSQITYANISFIPSGIVSGSSQVLGGSGVASGSYETTGRSIVSSSAQIVPLLPAGTVSGSSQVITSNAITLGTHTTGNYIQTITGTANQITVAGSGLESADVTLSIPQNIHTSATPTFAGLTINGAITATGDITAYYSDKRLKDISGNIDSALDKVNQISGVYYKQNELAETFGYTNYNQQVGVIAQEIQSVLPEAIALAPFDRDENGNSKSGENYLTVHYEKIVPLLIEAIKELSAKVKELENK